MRATHSLRTSLTIATPLRTMQPTDVLLEQVVDVFAKPITPVVALSANPYETCPIQPCSSLCNRHQSFLVLIDFFRFSFMFSFLASTADMGGALTSDRGGMLISTNPIVVFDRGIFGVFRLFRLLVEPLEASCVKRVLSNFARVRNSADEAAIL